MALAAQPNRLRVGDFSLPAVATPNPLISFDVVRFRGRHEVTTGGGREVVARAHVTLHEQLDAARRRTG